jgi:hypothetical protein
MIPIYGVTEPVCCIYMSCLCVGSIRRQCIEGPDPYQDGRVWVGISHHKGWRAENVGGTALLSARRLAHESDQAGRESDLLPGIPTPARTGCRCVQTID